MSKMNFLKKAALLSGVAMFGLTATAQAGFEWRGPIEPPRAPVSAPAIDHQESPMLMDHGVQELEPVTAWDGDMAPQPEPQAAQESVVAAAALPAASAMDQGDVISGFGSDLPLVIALQQVVPPGYQYSFANGVSPGVSVSWEGGKPWQRVLSDMLGTHGLGYRLQGNTVVIGAFASPALPQQAASSPAVYTPSAMPSDMAGMSPEPMADDMAPVMISSAPPRAEQLPGDMAAAHAMPQAVADAPAAAQEPVSIRRQKSSSLLARLGWARDTDEAEENIAVPRESAVPADMSVPPAMSEMPADAEGAAPVVVDGTQMAAAPMVTPPPPAQRVTGNSAWSGGKGQTLRDVLKAWSDKAQVELYWSIDYDYRLSDNVGYTGTYDEAVGSLLDQFASVRPQPYGQLHQSSNGPRVLVVKSYDLTP